MPTLLGGGGCLAVGEWPGLGGGFLAGFLSGLLGRGAEAPWGALAGSLGMDFLGGGGDGRTAGGDGLVVGGLGFGGSESEDVPADSGLLGGGGEGLTAGVLGLGGLADVSAEGGLLG